MFVFRLSFRAFFFFLFFKREFIYFVWGVGPGAVGGRERIQAGSMLSTESDTGLHPTNHKVVT